MTIQIALCIQAAAVIIVYGERGGPIGCLEKKGRADAITDGIPLKSSLGQRIYPHLPAKGSLSRQTQVHQQIDIIKPRPRVGYERQK